jgi:hypothetical protein
MYVEYVSFPSNWSRIARDLEDETYPLSSDWMQVLNDYRSNGWTASFELIDSLTDASIAHDQPAAIDSRHVTYHLSFDTETASPRILAAATVRQHEKPTS